MLSVTVFSLVFVGCLAEELVITTTYQAEDAGINLETNPQCAAWKLWRKTKETAVDFSSDEIDILARRRANVQIQNVEEAAKYGIPSELFEKYSKVRVNFLETCSFHPRVLKIASSKAAKRIGINTTSLCSSVETALAEEENAMELESVWINDTTALTKMGVFQPLLQKHQAVELIVKNICNKNSSTSDLLDFEEQYGRLSFDISAIDVSLQVLFDEVHDFYKLDNFQRLFDKMNIENFRPLPATQILPWLKKVKYDARTPPALFADDVVTVKTGLLIQSLGSFELSTMDYDLDGWLRMAWRDPRLRHSYSRPILVNDYTFLRKIWRPDPVFTNTKEATFHKVTFLNFYMLIFPRGEIFMDLRVFLKPTASQIVLCKYPHDSPATALKISSFGMSHETMKFEWFSQNAIQLNKDLQIPHLVLKRVEPGVCDGLRKSGNYSCVEARFFLKREVGFHIAHTYIPTAICVLFSMVSVWLPEEFIEGRIFVSLTVFLTLSAESNAAKEELPKVSYVKAIDIWFGFTSFFVFMTMLQALLVIGLEYNSMKLKTKCEEQTQFYGPYQLAAMKKSSRLFHRSARNCDTFCKVVYPVIFLLFLIHYVFVIIQGEEDKCL